MDRNWLKKIDTMPYFARMSHLPQKNHPSGYNSLMQANETGDSLRPHPRKSCLMNIDRPLLMQPSGTQQSGKRHIKPPSAAASSQIPGRSSFAPPVVSRNRIRQPSLKSYRKSVLPPVRFVAVPASTTSSCSLINEESSFMNGKNELVGTNGDNMPSLASRPNIVAITTHEIPSNVNTNNATDVGASAVAATTADAATSTVQLTVNGDMPFADWRHNTVAITTAETHEIPSVEITNTTEVRASAPTVTTVDASTSASPPAVDGDNMPSPTSRPNVVVKTTSATHETPSVANTIIEARVRAAAVTTTDQRTAGVIGSQAAAYSTVTDIPEMLGSLRSICLQMQGFLDKFTSIATNGIADDHAVIVRLDNVNARPTYDNGGVSSSQALPKKDAVRKKNGLPRWGGKAN